MTITKPADVLDALEVLLGRIHCAAQNAGFYTLIDVDLSFSQLKTLLVLSQSTESLPIHEIADSLRLSVGAAGRNIDRLVREGLVDRLEDSADRRIKRISLTERGRDLITGFQAQRRQHALDFVQSMDEVDRCRLLGALRPIVARFSGPTPNPSESRSAFPAQSPTRAQEQHV